MFVLSIKHKVRNYDSWKAVYDTFPPTAAGAKFAHVSRSTTDPNDVLVVAGWNSLTDAQAFTANPQLGQAMEKAGVVGAPRFETYEQVEVLGA